MSVDPEDPDPPPLPDVVLGFRMTLILDLSCEVEVTEKQSVRIPAPRIFIDVVSESSIFK